jgi:hypothetical protein
VIIIRDTIRQHFSSKDTFVIILDFSKAFDMCRTICARNDFSFQQNYKIKKSNSIGVIFQHYDQNRQIKEFINYFRSSLTWALPPMCRSRSIIRKEKL